MSLYRACGSFANFQRFHLTNIIKNEKWRIKLQYAWSKDFEDNRTRNKIILQHVGIFIVLREHDAVDT